MPLPRGQPTPIETRIEAVAELEAGTPIEDVARRYGVSVESVRNWKAAWDRDGFAHTPAASAASAADSASEEHDNDDNEPPQEQPDVTTSGPKQNGAPKGKNATPAGFVTRKGRTLPPLPKQDPGALRRLFPDDFKYKLARAALDRDADLAQMCAHYGFAESVIRGWMAKVRSGELTRQGRLPLPPRELEPDEHEAEIVPAPPPSYPIARQAQPGPAFDSSARELILQARIDALESEVAKWKARYQQALELARHD